MSKIVFAFLCLALLQIASALQCYSCRGSVCESEMKSWEKKTCGSSDVPITPNFQYGCLKLNYKDRVTQKPMVQRKCILTEIKDGKPNFNCPTSDGDPIDCPVCQTELCNSAPNTSLNFVALSGIALAFFASKLL